MPRRDRLSEHHQQLVGFVTTVARFMSAEAPAAAGFLTIEWHRVPLTGLRMAVSDVVEWSQALSEAQVAALDRQLADSGHPTLTAMRQSQYRKALEILDRGKVRNEAEWHVLNGYLADVADQTLTVSQREQAGRLMYEFELRRPATKADTGDESRRRDTGVHDSLPDTD
jgi:hypothetical protein